MASITVCGAAQVPVPPDRASVALSVTHVGATARAALGEVTARSARLDAVLDGLGISSEEWTTSGVTVAEEWAWQRDANTKVGYRARTSVTVRLTRLDLVPPLLQTAVDDAGAEIGGVQWSVSEANPARRWLLGAAALDAVARADAYAAALGLQRGAIEEVSDLPISSSHTPGDALFARKASADAAPTMNANPGEIELHATVFVRFAATPPA
jgi:uncharacterized protein YggE